MTHRLLQVVAQAGMTLQAQAQVVQVLGTVILAQAPQAGHLVQVIQAQAGHLVQAILVPQALGIDYDCHSRISNGSWCRSDCR